MTFKPQPWRICNRQRFLIAAMDELAGAARISFEGNLSESKLLHLPEASHEETSTLKRNTLWPKQDFVVLPLERNYTSPIIAAIGGTVPKTLLHIQIEKDGILQLGFYDNFQHAAFGEALNHEFFERLESEGVVEPGAPSSRQRR